MARIPGHRALDRVMKALGWRWVSLSSSSFRLLKARGHKYLRRVPYFDKRGNRKYRYYYKVTGRAGGAAAVAHVDDVRLGASFKDHDDDDKHKGHWTVAEVGTDGSVVLAHDVTGESRVFSSASDAVAFIDDGHAASVEAHKTRQEARIKRDWLDAGQHGSDRHKERLKQRARVLGVALNAPLDRDDPVPDVAPGPVVSDEVMQTLMDFDTAARAWGWGEVLLSQLNGMMYAFVNEHMHSGRRFNRAKAIRALEDMRSDFMGQIPDPRVVMIGGVAVETIDSSIEQYVGNFVWELFATRMKTLQESSAADVRYFLGKDLIGNEYLHFKKVNFGFKKKSTAQVEYLRRDWAEKVKLLKGQLSDAAALPEAHHQLMARMGVRLRALFHPVFGLEGRAGWSGLATTDPRTKLPLVYLSDSGLTGEDETGTTLTHELGHMIDRATGWGQMGAVLEDQMGADKVAMRRKDVRVSEGLTLDDMYRWDMQFILWQRKTVEWTAEGYRYAYRDGHAMKTTAQPDDLDLPALRKAWDGLVSRALDAPTDEQRAAMERASRMGRRLTVLHKVKVQTRILG